MKLSADGKTLLKVDNSDIKKDGSYDISRGVTSIGYSAFRACTGLQIITIPEGVTSIGHSAFRGCTGLQTITIPQGVTSIGDSAFDGCTGLKVIILPLGVTSIGDYAFSGCTGLQAITIPQGVISIGDSAFENCTGLQAITIPQGVLSIGHWAFSNCTGLQTITIPQGITFIGVWAFSNCARLQVITIPQGVASIGHWAFRDCIGLHVITIPEGVISIGNEAFNACSNLHSIVIAGQDDASIQYVTDLLPDSLKSKVTSMELAEEAFRILNAQLSKVALISEINPLYPYFNLDAQYVSMVTVENEAKGNIEKKCTKLPDDIFQYMNRFLVSENPNYQKMQTLVHRVSFPKNKDQIETYKSQVEGIVNECIAKMKENNKPVAKKHYPFFQTDTTQKPDALEKKTLDEVSEDCVAKIG